MGEGEDEEANSVVQYFCESQDISGTWATLNGPKLQPQAMPGASEPCYSCLAYLDPTTQTSHLSNTENS